MSELLRKLVNGRVPSIDTVSIKLIWRKGEVY